MNIFEILGIIIGAPIMLLGITGISGDIFSGFGRKINRVPLLESVSDAATGMMMLVTGSLIIIGAFGFSATL